jgi:translation initiation factor eIF-2B subunit delta
MTAPTLESRIRDLAQDNVSGAAELARDAADVLALLAKQSEARDLCSFLGEVSSTGRRVVRAQPSMAPLFNLINGVLFRLDGVESLEEARSRVEASARGFAEELASSGSRIAEEALSLLTDGYTVLTHSRSSTVLAALLLARDRGLEFEVVCTESRPLYEGRKVAEALSEAGIHTTLVTDASVSHIVPRVNLVMVGADSVSSDGLVNKMGTYGVALAARAHGVPFYALCGSEKLLPAGSPYFEVQARDPEEVWPGSPEAVEVLNYYFEVTPLEYLSGLVTEKGLITPGELWEMLGGLKIHEMLLEQGA